jgi:hypothetical protein
MMLQKHPKGGSQQLVDAESMEEADSGNLAACSNGPDAGTLVEANSIPFESTRIFHLSFRYFKTLPEKIDSQELLKDGFPGVLHNTQEEI